MNKELTELLDLISLKSPLQEKKLNAYLPHQSDAFYKEVDEFLIHYKEYLKSIDIPFQYAVDAYLKMCNDMMSCQIKFMKTGKYPVEQSKAAFANVYSSKLEMTSYMVGLAISQFLWSTHYEMYSCVKDNLRKYSDEVNSYLEIGPGHGLFFTYAIQHLKNCKNFTAVDISPISIDITKSIINFVYKNVNDKVTYHNIDMLELELEKKYDFISMGEVLEHVNYPDTLLKKLNSLLTPNGKAFVSTCVDCPAIDHVYHFTSIEQIRELLRDCNFKIIEEKILPVENLPMEEIIARRITINYCAIIGRII